MEESRLTHIKDLGSNKHSKVVALYQCSCGNTHEATKSAVKSNRIRSCGCLQKERAGTYLLKHGHSRAYNKSRTYRIWVGIHTRCTNQKSKDYKDYGGRGITRCKSWDNFSTFLQDMGECPANSSINRINNNKGYTRLNCVWATVLEQSRNKRSNRIIAAHGISLCISEWCEILELPSKRILPRLRLGWTEYGALFSPKFTQKINQATKELKDEKVEVCI